MYVDGGTLKKSFFGQGDIIFKEGDAGDAAYIVETGSIGIFKIVEGADLQLATIRAGELFGEMAIIDGSKRMAHAVALEESVIVNIPRAGIEAMLAKQPSMIKTLIHILVDNLRNVHEVYMKRPRSLRDSVVAISVSADALRKFLKRNPSVDTGGEARQRIDEVDAHATVLHDIVGRWRDPRDSVIDVVDEPPAAGSARKSGGENST
jgi:CRP/FNR family transcriptional regulator, cyclic AMP receptor protein